MDKGLIFGKFYPFHNGHKALVDFALRRCKHLVILVCVSDRESISGEIRKEWIDNTYASNPSISVRVFEYNEKELPNTSVSSEAVSEIWATTFKKLEPQTDVLFTSEPYGEFVSKFMNISHISFDPPRAQVSISATDIRRNPHKYWHYLPKAVKPYFTKKIILLGTESTGKTMLSKKLATYFNAGWVPELGREIIPDSQQIFWADLHLVAQAHAECIHQTCEAGHPIVFIDTDIHITQSYAQFLFNKKLEVSDEIYNMNRADLYLFSTSDAPHIQDGTRLDEVTRNQLDTSHRLTLSQNNIMYREISGLWDERFAQAVKLVEALL